MILFLILPFIHTFKELLLISLINKTYSNQLYSFLSIYPRKYEIFPRRTWINMVYCQICNTSINLNYIKSIILLIHHQEDVFLPVINGKVEEKVFKNIYIIYNQCRYFSLNPP